ncbi:tyrosine-type recombinase/integrase [Lichenihabitans psoromatis]|uniref:tyrosine-type recombinase/integrase n=1 Tax=Lichenihabitans psoromatis TaxID=2528642 RepID=UPI00103843FA|nr:tyrosine-type recombinase/integrase [Lichenihabitans psoromatis]
MSTFLTRRDGWWHFARRVPEPFTGLDKRGIVKQSTKVRVADDPRGIRAGKVAGQINAELEIYWRALSDGRSAEAAVRYEAARLRSRQLGFDYTPAEQLAERPMRELATRLQSFLSIEQKEGGSAAASLLGGVPVPQIQLSNLFAEFEKLSRAGNNDFSPDQLRKWRNPKLRAIANLIAKIGDKPINHVTRGDTLDFQGWWQDRVLAEGIDIGTANKDIGHLNKMFRTVDQKHRLGLAAVFGQLRIEGEETGSRSAFATGFIQDQLLATGALDALNSEARRVLYLIAETGLRLSEAVNLTNDTIHLNADVPHVQVRPDNRRMKTRQSERDIPLVGVALAAMQAQPTGFPRYRDKAAGLSALVNKVLGLHQLRPTSSHSLYSLRHSFEDRLTAVEAPEKLIAALMGHKYSRPKYGSGPSLEQKREWLRRIAFTPPAVV